MASVLTLARGILTLANGPRNVWIWLCGSWRGTGVTLRVVQLHIGHANCCRYTVAAVALEQLSFADCIRHKAVVMDVATTEAKEGGNAVLGVFYDMEARCAMVCGLAWGAVAQCMFVAGPIGQTKQLSWALSFC